MRQRSITDQVNKPVTITSKNVVRIFRRAIKVLKKAKIQDTFDYGQFYDNKTQSKTMGARS